MDLTPGARLALLLLEGFDHLVQEVVTELEAQGHPGVTATHEFALVAVDEGANTASELGRRIGVSKQAAAKTIAALTELGYVDIEADPLDARRKRLRVTERGHEMTAIGARRFDELRAAWAQRLPDDCDVHAVEQALVLLLGHEPRQAPSKVAS